MTVIEKADRFTTAQSATSWRRWAIVGVLIGAVAAGIYAVYFSSFLTVRQERVLGAVHVSADAVRQAAAVPPGIQMARVDTDAVAARVSALGWVKSVEIRRGWPNVLVVVVTERTPVAVVPSGLIFPGCRRPSAAGPGAACAGSQGPPCGNSSGSVPRVGGSPSSD